MQNNLNGLTITGFRDKNQPFDESLFRENPTVESVRSMIRRFFTTSVQTPYKDATSYGLKSFAECYLNCYVANGEFIYAMHLEGFQITHLDHWNPNCYFNISRRDLTALRKVTY